MGKPFQADLPGGCSIEVGATYADRECAVVSGAYISVGENCLDDEWLSVIQIPTETLPSLIAALQAALSKAEGGEGQDA